MLYRQQAIIIKLRDFQETDKIAVLLGSNKGRIEAITKGVRKPTSRKSASIDLINLANFSIATGKSLDIVTEVVLVSSFPKIKSDVFKTSAAYYLLQLVDKFYQDENQGEEIYDSLKTALETLERLDHDYIKIYAVVLSFQAKLLYLSGFLETEIRSIKEKSVVERLMKVTKFFQSNSITESPRLKLTQKDIDMLDQYLYNQILNVLEKDLASYRFFKQIAADQK